MIDPKEIEELRFALNQFIACWNHRYTILNRLQIDDQFVNAMQASHRILQIINPIKEPLEKDATVATATGDSCPRCFGMRILRKGGCTTCEDCKFFLGCGQ